MRICIINTGGTISSVGQPLTPMPAARFADAVGALLMPGLQAALPGVDLHVDTGLRFPDTPSGMLDSTDLRPADWCRIARHLLRLYADHDAFVILHGTDTMDYSGAALSFLLNAFDDLGLGTHVLAKPVILTGSQMPLFRDMPDGLTLDPLSDAARNLGGALQAARLRIPEVALFFDGKLLRGNRALKVSTARFAAFDSPHLPPLAESGIGIWHGDAPALEGPAAPGHALDPGPALARIDAIAARIGDERIVTLPAVPADHRDAHPVLADMIHAALNAGATGLILEGFGEGNLPQGAGALRTALDRAAAAGVLAVVTSRAIGGSVGAFHYAAGAWIAGTGAVSGGDMTPVAALAKMTVLRAGGLRGTALATAMRRSLAGECRATDRFADALRPGQALRAADGDALLENDPAHGPVLRMGGDILWQAPGPGTLRLRGGLVLTAPDGGLLWSGPSALPGALAVLTAAGLRLIGPDGNGRDRIVLPC